MKYLSSDNGKLARRRRLNLNITFLKTLAYHLYVFSSKGKPLHAMDSCTQSECLPPHITALNNTWWALRVPVCLSLPVVGAPAEGRCE